MTQWCNVLRTKNSTNYSLFRGGHRVEVRNISSKNFSSSLLAIAVKELRRRRRKNATRRRVILASVVNASRRRRRDLGLYLSTTDCLYMFKCYFYVF